MTQAAELISDSYRQLNASMHTDKSGWGTTGQRWGSVVMTIANILKTQDVLDYGCGKGSLSAVLPFPIQQYDPAIPERSALPKPAKVVACLDVLEHIEPDRIDAVLKHLQELVLASGFFVICTSPALNVLPDGRNAHLLVRQPSWWIKKLVSYFDIMELKVAPPELIVRVAPLSESESAETEK